MRILITGCCGFIGTNLVRRFAQDHQVIGIDNLSRSGSEKNLAYLQKNYIFDFRNMDIRNDLNVLPEVDVIFHMAGQVGVGKSIEDPFYDFSVNAFGTLNILEYARGHEKKPIVIYASTNKVYGSLQTEEPVKNTQPIDFHTPYGVSKGTGDQYVKDYTRIYGVPGVVFRQSCIYGPFQHGAEEQGWVAWFMIANKTKQPITIYGDGTQVRDILYVEDLIDLYELAIKNIDKFKGQSFNAGGGKNNTLSLLQLIDKANITTKISYADWRQADQKCYISDITDLEAYGWWPKVGVDMGLQMLSNFVNLNW